MRIVSVGHGLFAAILIAIGIIGLIHSGYAAIWHGVPKGFPLREALPYLCAVIALGCGLGLLAQRTAAPAIRVWLAFYLLWTVLFKLRFILFHPLVEGSYQSNGENAVILAGSWVLFTWLATDWDRHRIGFATGERGLRIARALYGLALIAFGLSHFFYLNFTAPLVPAWLPGPVGWAYFTGITYLAAGVAVLVGVYARLAAALSTLQMGLFLLLIWIPRGVTGRLSEFQWGEVVVNCALVAAAWLVTESYRDRPWLALRKR
ncbi:MAG TPA: hypothetical protein VFM15_01755 [Gammaproteobacteria bacterium]|nr:hypothetical protein [Gammaproteobacteria bacterium]